MNERDHFSPAKAAEESALSLLGALAVAHATIEEDWGRYGVLPPTEVADMLKKEIREAPDPVLMGQANQAAWNAIDVLWAFACAYDADCYTDAVRYPWQVMKDIIRPAMKVRERWRNNTQEVDHDRARDERRTDAGAADAEGIEGDRH